MSFEFTKITVGRIGLGEVDWREIPHIATDMDMDFDTPVEMTIVEARVFANSIIELCNQLVGKDEEMEREIEK